MNYNSCITNLSFNFIYVSSTSDIWCIDFLNLNWLSLFWFDQAFHFDRDDVALKGFAKFFDESSKEEREHAERLMKFQNQRGGRIVLEDIKKPVKQDWASGLEAMEAALELEKTVNQSLLDLHAVATKNSDPQVSFVLWNLWIACEFLLFL